RIYVVNGPAARKLKGTVRIVNTVSRTPGDWQSGLSPFLLGPVPLYDGRESFCFENAWQFAKAYRCHIDPSGEPSPEYWKWAARGWADRVAHRYPMGKGSKPEYSYWCGEKLGYIDARLRIYFPLYRDAVAKTQAFSRLLSIYKNERVIALFDFDGYSHESMGMTLADVLLNDRRPMGHAFVLKAMLQYGPEVTPAEILRENGREC